MGDVATTPIDTRPAPASGQSTLDLRAALGRAVRSAINLRVVTMVGTPSVTGEIEALRVSVGTTSLKDVAVTNINLLEGDIFTCVSEAIAKGELADIKALHDGMVAKADSIVERNVRLLKELIQAGFEEFKGLAEPRKQTNVT